MPIGPDSPTPRVIEMFIFLVLAVIIAQFIMGVQLTSIEYFLLTLGFLYGGARFYFLVSDWWNSRDTHEKRSE